MTAQIRSFREADLPVLLAMLKASFSEDRLPYMHYYNGDLLAWLSERRIEVLMAEVNGKVVGSTAYNDGYWGEEIEWLLINEAGDWRPIGDALVKEAEKHVKRGAVFTSVTAGSTKAEEWIRRGYAQDGGLNLMVASLSKKRAIPTVPEGTVLRSLGAGEEKEFVELVNAGFEWERVKVGDIEKWKVETPPFNVDWVQVAEVDDRLVSVVVAKSDVGYNRVFNARRGYLGPATTLKEWRQRNLASALTLQAMNFLLERGMDSVCLFTSETNAAAVGLLSSVGFRVEYNWKFMRKQLNA